MALPSALPGDWDTYGPGEKIDYFNTMGVTPEDLMSVGVGQGDIDWMRNNGYIVGLSQVNNELPIETEAYTGVKPGALASVATPTYVEPQPVDTEPVRTIQQPIYTEPEPAPSDPIADLASELGLPKFIVANYINSGHSTDEVRNIFAPSPPPQPVYTPPSAPAQPVYNVFGLSWDSGASLGTKQGYVQTLLNQGVTPDQIKAKIAELDPSRATQENFDALGIPKPPLAQPPAATIVDLPEETEAVTGVKPREASDFRASTTTAENYLMGVDPNIQSKFFKPGSSDRYTGTFVNTYKLADGKLVPIDANSQSVGDENTVFMVGGAPSGDYAGQQRESQAYIMKNGVLTPIGTPQKYTAPEDTPFFREFLIEGVLPMALAAAGGLGLTEALGATLSGGALAGSSAAALGSGALNLGAQILAGKDPIDALKGSVLSAGVGMVANQVGSMLPPEMATVGKQALTQLITTGKINPLALATSAGIAYASDTLAAETGLDKATASKLVNAGYQLFQGNELGALSTLAQAAVSSGLGGSDSQVKPQDQATFLEANASPLGAGAFSPIQAEDEQIAQQQRVTAANQAISDYLGPGNDLSREGLVSKLQSLGFNATDSENYAKQADSQIEQRRVATDVMSRYSKIDPEFGTPQLDRNTAIQEMVAAGMSSDRANELLNGIDAQNAIKLENKLSVQSAYQNFISGKGTEEALRSAMTSAGYSDADINNLAVKGRGIIEGQKLTAGEGAQERAAALPDVRAEIAAKPTFNEAYATAREKLGAGATFTWQGKSYSTATAEERPDLTAAGMAAKAMQGDPQFQVALSETALQNQRGISQVLSDYSQKGGDLTRESAIDRLERLGVTKDQASFFLDQKDGKIPYTFDQFKSAVPTADADAYRAYVVAFNELKNKGVPTSLIDISGYAASGARPNMPALINGISTAFGMGAEAAGNTLKAFGTMGEALGLDTAKMSDFGRKLENIAQEMYPQALINSENEVKARFANATNAKELGMAIVDSVVNNPGAVAKMVGVEGVQEIPNIVLALSTGGAYGAVRYAGLLAGLGLDVVESAGLQGAQKVEEGLAKGLSRAAAVKGAVDDMKTAGVVTTLMTAAADRVPFGGTVAKTLIKGSASEGAEEYVIARATGADHMSALRQAAFGALIGGPTEASLQGAGNLTSVVINGDAMVGTYADGTKVTITEPSGATELKIDVITPSVVTSNVTSTLTSDLMSGVDLNTAISNVVTANVGSDLSGTIDSTVKVLVGNNVNLTQGVSVLTSSALTTTGDTKTVVNQVVSSLASNNVDLNANAGSVVSGALGGGASVNTAVKDTLTAIVGNGGTAASATPSIIDAVSVKTGGDANSVTNAASTIIANAGGDKNAAVAAITAAANATNGNATVAADLVATVAKTGNADATAAAVDAAITATNGAALGATVTSALNNNANANATITAAVNAAIDTKVQAGTSLETAAVGAVAASIGGGLNAGASANDVINAAVNTAIQAAKGDQEVVASVLQTSAAAGVGAGGDVSTVVAATTKAAVDGGVSAATAAVSAVAGIAASGGDVSAAATAASNASGTQVTTSVEGGKTVITATSGDTVTRSVVDAASGTTLTSVTDLKTNQTSTTVTDASTQQDIANLQESVGQIKTDLTAKIDASIKAGQDADAAIQTALDQVAASVGTTKTDLLAQLGTTEAALKGDVKTLSDTVTKINTDLTTEIKNVLKTTQDADAVLNTSINKVASDLGLTKDQLLDQIGKTESQLKTEIQTTQDTITQVKTDLTTQINTLAKTTADADKIITSSIEKVAEDLGLTKKELLDTIGETEVSLKAELATELGKVAASLGKEIKGIKTGLASSAAIAAAQPIRGVSLDDGWLKGRMLQAGRAEGYRDPLAQFQALQEEAQREEMIKQIEPALAEVLMQRETPYYSYGEEAPIDDILGLEQEESEAEPVFRMGGSVSPLNIQMMYARGGQMREDFRQGKHVAGEGDGQSDDIPAWLADGEFVFPADVVSALGNGSTKAGTDMLYEMMHEIRKRARSKGPKDLPPPAHKSPLDYLKSRK